MTQNPNTRLTVAVGVDLPDNAAAAIVEREPRVDLVLNRSLVRPQRWAGDWEGDPTFRRTAEQDSRFMDSLCRADALFGIPDVDPSLLKRVIDRSQSLQWVHTTAAGGGGQVKAASLTSDQLARIAFTTAAGAHGSTLAEFAVFGIMAGAKNLRRLERDQAGRLWPSARWYMKHLDEMTVLIAGLGGIGQVCVNRFKAFGSTVWGMSRSGRAVEGVDRVVALDELTDVIREVDAVVITLPGTAATEKMFDSRVFEAARPGLLISNVGRGSVIDEDALVAALNSGQVGFAALDVFASEPLEADSPLWSHPKVLVSPHTAALSAQEPVRVAELFAENARRLLDGERLLKQVDTVDFY